MINAMNFEFKIKISLRVNGAEEVSLGHLLEI